MNWPAASKRGNLQPVRGTSLVSLVLLVSCGMPSKQDMGCTPADCDDQNVCTTDTCSAGVCANTAVPIPLSPQGVCVVQSCDPVLGVQETPIAVDDADACTVDLCDSAAGVSHAPAMVDDANACTIDSCDPVGGPAHTPVVVDDGDLCTADACDPVTGPANTPVSFDDGNACTTDACDPLLGVSHTPVPVDDGNPLTVDACDPLTGTITHRCSDQVLMLLPGNPGADAGSYPAAGWWTNDTRANGTVTVDGSLGAPVGFGCTSARLVTGASTSPGPSADKAQLFSYALAGTPLADISTVGYWAFRSSASTGNALIHLSLNVTVTGSSVPTGFATLVYEPYQQVGGAAAIQNDVWQRWDATSSVAGQGLWWTSRLSNGTPGSQANPQPWAAFQTQFSDARVLGYGFNVGSANPNMVVGGDGLVFGAATTDF